VKRVLVPVDGNKAGDEAVALACDLVKRTKGQVFVIYIIQVSRALPLDAELIMENARGEEILDRAKRIGEERNCELDTRLLQAREAGPAIVDEAVERGVDLVMMALTYQKRFGEFDVGSTASYVLKNAPCRVWVCREAMA